MSSLIAPSSLAAGAALRHDHHWALYAIGAVALLLLFIGIHNAWDTVTYMVVSQRKDSWDTLRPLSLPPKPLEAVREFRTSVTFVRELADEQRERLGVAGDP